MYHCVVTCYRAYCMYCKNNSYHQKLDENFSFFLDLVGKIHHKLNENFRVIHILVRFFCNLKTWNALSFVATTKNQRDMPHDSCKGALVRETHLQPQASIAFIFVENEGKYTL